MSETKTSNLDRRGVQLGFSGWDTRAPLILRRRALRQHLAATEQIGHCVAADGAGLPGAERRRLGPTPIFHHPYRRRHGHDARRDWSDSDRLRRSQHAERLLRGGSPLIRSKSGPAGGSVTTKSWRMPSTLTLYSSISRDRM